MKRGLIIGTILLCATNVMGQEAPKAENTSPTRLEYLQLKLEKLQLEAQVIQNRFKDIQTEAAPIVEEIKKLQTPPPPAPEGKKGKK